MKEYTVIYEQQPDNWSACVPDLSGCVATGRNRNDVETQILEAIQFHIEGLRQHGEPIPEPTIEAGRIVLTTWFNGVLRSASHTLLPTACCIPGNCFRTISYLLNAG